MLDVRRVTKCYSSVPAVENVSFTIQPGQVLGYIGPNGSGKSTTVKMITGLLEPTRGEIFFDGSNIHDDLTAHKRRLGYVPEEANLYPFLSGLEYLELAGRLRAMAESLLQRRAAALLKVFSMFQHRHTAIATYSKGMRQRILLISALLHNPDLIIFDEPLSGLDVTSAMIFRELVSGLSRERKTIFYCSHVLDAVERVCSHVTILQNGKQVACGAVEELKRFQAMPSLEAAFSHLVQDGDARKSADAIVDAVITQ